MKSDGKERINKNRDARKQGRPKGIRLNKTRGEELLRWVASNWKKRGSTLIDATDLAGPIFQALTEAGIRYPPTMASLETSLAGQFNGKRTLAKSTILGIALLCDVQAGALSQSLRSNGALPNLTPKEGQQAVDASLQPGNDARYRQQHQEKIKDDLEKFLALESELRESKCQLGHLHGQLELVGSQIMDKIYAALLLGYFYDRREETGAQQRSIFRDMAFKLGLPTAIAGEKNPTDLNELADFMTKTSNALMVKYGEAANAAFNLGGILRDLDERGFNLMCQPDAWGEVEIGLKTLKCDFLLPAVSRFWEACKTAAKIPDEASSFFDALLKFVAGQFLNPARDPAADRRLRHFIENPIRVPKVVRIENATLHVIGLHTSDGIPKIVRAENETPLKIGKWVCILVCGRPIMRKRR
jgi:hypothetical protein